jgi:3-oxoacyl-(acyl-carrier-protein) synthase
MDAAITGVGTLSPLGLDLESFWNSLLQEKNCVQSGIGAFGDSDWDEIRRRVQARGKNCEKYFSKIAQVSFLAACEAMQKASWENLDDEDGLILGTNTGQVIHWEKLLIDAYKKNNYDEFLNKGGISTPGQSLHQLSSMLNFRGKSMMIVSACSASTQALGLAAEWVKSGRVKRCLVGGAEVLTTLSVEGFRCLGLLSALPSRPFDEKRNGINLSEASAFFCVERAEKASKAVAVIRGFSTNSDAYHLTGPHPEGAGTAAAFTQALRMSKLQASDIDWIHAHGTASPSNDKAEGMAIAKVFPGVAVSSTKGYHGHSLGASGALESAVCVEALRQQMKVKTLGCEVLDPTLKINLQFTHEHTKIRHVLKNSLGFGGVNAALILSHPSTIGGEK